jgi:hypothetical protein
MSRDLELRLHYSNLECREWMNNMSEGKSQMLEEPLSPNRLSDDYQCLRPV